MKIFEDFTKKDILSYLIIVIVVILIRSFIVTPVTVSGVSMYDTLENKDIMLLNKLTYKFHDIKRFDIVVIKHNDELLIKRIIGFPGEVIEYKNNQLYVDGKEVKDPYKYGKTEDFKSKKLKKGYYFVLGDNREDSLDSRYFGAFNRKSIKGKTSFVVFPFSRWGHKD